VSSIQQAIALLGYKNISNIVMTLSVFDTLKHSGKSSFNRRGFWIHSIATAIISERIAKESMYRATDDVFTAGLLHDLGKVFMDGYLHEEFEKVIEAAEQSNSSFFEAEHSLFDVDHAMVGEWITRTWKLPINVVAVIKHHHEELSQRKGLAVSQDTTIDVVRLSDILVRRAGCGENGDGREYAPQLSEDLFRRLPLGKNDTGKILKSLKTKLKNSETLLNFAAGG
jgi:putative nucleotidyltransferase with HDIG domain